jgi:hypothetical protein
MSERCPRRIFRIIPRLYPVRRTISLIAPLLGQREDRGVCFLSAQVALVLQLLGKGQKRRIDHRSSHCRPDLTHGLPNSFEKGLTRVFHQMPPVGDPDRVRKRPLGCDRVAASTIPGDETDLRLLRQPGLSGGWLAIWQKSDRRMPFKVADKRAIAVIAPPRPVIDADNRRRRKASWSTPANHAQQRVVAHLDVEPARRWGSRSASQRNGETVNHIVEAARTSRSWFDSLEAFGKGPPIATPSVAEKATGPQNQRYSHACGRKIRVFFDTDCARGSTTNPRGTSSETSNPCMALIPCPNQSQSGASTSSKVSQSPKTTPFVAH